MILFQVRDLAAKSCGEPHVAPSWEIAKASLGAMLAKTPELAERSRSILIECVGLWDPETGIGSVYVPEDRETVSGDFCLAQFRAACVIEETSKQAEADDLGQAIFEERCRVQNEVDAQVRNHQIMLEHAAKEEEDE